MSEVGVSRNQRDFLRIVRFATALAFGVAAGVLYAVKPTGSGFALEFSFGVVPAFLVGAALGWGYWQLIFKRVAAHDSATGKRQFKRYTIGLAVIGLACFFYPMRYVTRGALGDVLQGIAMAFFLVGLVGVLLWLVARLLNAPSNSTEQHDE